MKNHFLLGALLFCGGALVSTQPAAHAQSAEVASESPLASITLPGSPTRIAPDDSTAWASDVLQKLVEAGGPKVKRGKTEILAWGSQDYSPKNAAKFKARIGAALERAGWKYEEVGPLGDKGATTVTATRMSPTRRGLIGFWAPTSSALLLAWTEMLPIKDEGDGDNENTGDTDTGNEDSGDIAPPRNNSKGGGFETPSPQQLRSGPGALVFEVPGGGGRHIINVSKGQKPPRVAFPALAPKAGFARGYVKNGKGQPLAGATIGIRSSSAGGFTSGANGKTDAKGYYEIRVPWGAAEFYNAAYFDDYYDSRAAFGLLPADGEMSSFGSENGLVENWVLPSFGIADPDAVADQPQFFGNYYGGSFSLGYFAADPRFQGYDKALPVGSEIQFALVPVRGLFDGSKGRNLVFKQRVEDGIALGFTAVNIPVGQYRVSAVLYTNGRGSELNIVESGPNAAKPFGLEPKKATGTSVLTFRPRGATASDVAPGKSNWAPLDITLKP